MPIPLDGKRGGNRDALGKKAFSKAAILNFLLYNSSENILLLFPLYPLIILSSFCHLAAKLGVGVFGKNNVEKGKGDDLRNSGTDAERRTRADNLGTRTDANTEADNPSKAADNLGTVVDDLGTATEDLGTVTDNLGIASDDPGTEIDNLGIATDDLDTAVDNPGMAANDPGTGTDTDKGVNNSSTTASNKAYVVSFFALRHAFFLLTSSSELIIASLPSSLLCSSLTTLRSKLILLCSVTLVKQRSPSSTYPVDEMWTPSLNKVLLGISAVVRLLSFLARYFQS